MRMQGLLALVLATVAATAALAQESGEPSLGGGSSGPALTASLSQLLADDYEIKSAVPNGAKLIIFLQKKQSAYACEFVSITKTRCGSLN